MRGGVVRSTSLAAVVVLVALMVSGPTAQAAPTATMTQSKTTPDVVGGSVTPGQAFTYELSASCSGLTESCANAKTVDVIPPGLDIVSLPPSSPPLYTVDYVAATRTLTITYTDVLTSPPSSIGLRAGSPRTVDVHVRVPANTSITSGTVIDNSATGSADNANPSTDTASVTVSVPRVVTPVASKSFSTSTLIARTAATTTATLGVRNGSSSSAGVTQLTVGDTTKATWDDFDLVSLGPLGAFPAGADQVSVQYCTAPAPCAAAQFTAGPFTAGPALDLPGGVAPGSVTGLRFVFKAASGAVLPVSTIAAQVPIQLQLRDTVRSTGLPLDPPTNLTQSNCASPGATDVVAGVVTGADACAPFTVLPGTATVAVAKSFVPDAATPPTYTSNGLAVAGQNSGASAITTATNTSAFPVPNLTIVEPSLTAATQFDRLDTDAIRLVFPAGATAATVSVSCRNFTSATFTPAKPAGSATLDLASTGCPGSVPLRVAVTYTGSIAPGAAARLGVHGTLNTTATPGNVVNCADGSIAAGAQGSASGTGCATLVVQTPRGSVTGTKSVNRGSTNGQLVPGQPLTFNLSASNDGNLPQTTFILSDPDPLAAGPSPFDVVRLTAATVSTTPAALAARVRIEIHQPGGAWVPYTGATAAQLLAATGIRTVLTGGSVTPSDVVRLSFTVVVRDGVPLGTALTNCQSTAVQTVQGPSGSGSRCAPALTVNPGSSAGAVGKAIAPPQVAEALPGVPPQSAQVRLQAQNTGNLPMNRIVVTDVDPGFFDGVDLAAMGAANFPPGANRVRVDACVTAASCAGGTFVLGTAAAAPVLPAGVAPGDVTGLRFTFTNAAGGYLLVPGNNFPATGVCPNSTICFSVTPRLELRSTPGRPPASPLSDTATGGGETELTPGALSPFGSAVAPLAIVPGTTELSAAKSTTATTVGPGQTALFSLLTRNTGTGAVPGLVVTDPIPTGLVFDESFVGDGGQPFTITSTVPAGTPPLPAPVFTLTRDPTTNAVTSLRWTFPAGFDFLPGSTVTIGVSQGLVPGSPAGLTRTDTYGAASTVPATQATLACSGSTQVSDPLYGPGPACTASAAVRTVGGSSVDARKWVHGDDSLGFYNPITQTSVTPGAPGCPYLLVGAEAYTRYPCIAIVLPGQDFAFLLDVTDVGTTPSTQIRLLDTLPAPGDVGIIAPGARLTEWNPRAILAGAPTQISGPGTSTFTYSEDNPVCLNNIARQPAVCPAGAWTPGYRAAAGAFQAFVDFSPPLQPTERFTIRVPMRAPVDNDTTTNPLPIAWNSFAHTDFMINNGLPQQLPAVEPRKVGIAMPFGNLEITKTLSGPPLPPGSKIGPFTAQYECTLTPAGGGAPVPVASGTGDFAVGAPFTARHIPAGAICRVWETDSGGGIASNPVTNPVVVTIRPDATGSSPSPVVLDNNFPAPRLIVTKAVEGAEVGFAAGPYSIDVDCRLNGVPTTGYPRTLTFADSGSQSLTDIPIGADCTVAEPDDRGASSVTTAYSEGDHATISALVDAVASVTNTYDPAALTVSKQVVGPGTAGPYRFALACELVSGAGTTIPLTLPATDAAFTLSNGGRRVVMVPRGAHCVVTETSPPAGVQVTYNGSSSAGAVTVDAVTTVAVVNRFPTPTTGSSGSVPPSGGAEGSTTGAGGGGPSGNGTGGVADGGGLASTGAAVRPGIAAGLLLLLGGLTLLVTGRRRGRHQ